MCIGRGAQVFKRLIPPTPFGHHITKLPPLASSDLNTRRNASWRSVRLTYWNINSPFQNEPISILVLGLCIGFIVFHVSTTLMGRKHALCTASFSISTSILWEHSWIQFPVHFGSPSALLSSRMSTFSWSLAFECTQNAPATATTSTPNGTGSSHLN